MEKPFGKDLASARELQKSLEPDWKEAELFRIDHYLGKEMVKNILILRFGNSFLGATWNRHHIDNVQISFKEPFGTEGRGGYFDEFGIIRDVMQNHLLQVLTLLAMERPISFSAEDIRDEKVRVLRAIPAIEPKNVIIGQYGRSLDGGKPSYKEDDTVPKDSRCPTFCALVAYIKNERWDGVPFIMKAGKALNEQKTEIRVQFKDVTSGIFKDIPRNELVMRIQPNESVYIKMNSKLPGLSMQTVVTELDLTYRRRFSDLKIPEAYESLILDCLKGDHSNFVRDDELDASWRIFTPLLHYLDDNKEIIPMEYPYGRLRRLRREGPARLTGTYRLSRSCRARRLHLLVRLQVLGRGGVPMADHVGHTAKQVVSGNASRRRRRGGARDPGLTKGFEQLNKCRHAVRTLNRRRPTTFGWTSLTTCGNCYRGMPWQWAIHRRKAARAAVVVDRPSLRFASSVSMSRRSVDDPLPLEDHRRKTDLLQEPPQCQIENRQCILSRAPSPAVWRVLEIESPSTWGSPSRLENSRARISATPRKN